MGKLLGPLKVDNLNWMMFRQGTVTSQPERLKKFLSTFFHRIVINSFVRSISNSDFRNQFCQCQTAKCFYNASYIAK